MTYYIGALPAYRYHIATKNIKLIITIITESISNAWSTWFYAEMEKSYSNKIAIKNIVITTPKILPISFLAENAVKIKIRDNVTFPKELAKAAIKYFLSIIIGMALHVSIKSANYKFPNKINQYTSSISIIYIGNTYGQIQDQKEVQYNIYFYISAFPFCLFRL